MCDIPEEELEKRATSSSKPTSSGVAGEKVDRQCRKCTNERSVTVFRKDNLCKDCFLDAFRNRFKAASSEIRLLGNQTKGPRTTRPQILVGFSGGLSSRVLLHVLSQSLYSDRGTHRMQYFDVHIVHIDETAILPLSDQTEREERLKYIKAVASSYPTFLGVSIVPLESIFAEEGEDDQGPEGTVGSLVVYPRSPSPERLDSWRSQLLQLFQSVDSQTSKEDLSFHLSQQLLLRIASRSKFQALLIGECADRTAMRAISNITKGKGFSLPYDIQSVPLALKEATGSLRKQSKGPKKSRPPKSLQKKEASDQTKNNKVNSEAFLVRPMNDLLIKEIALFHRYSRLSDLDLSSFNLFDPSSSPVETLPFFRSLDTMPSAKQRSINLLTEGFVSKLQEEFSHTVHTILRTIDKLRIPTLVSQQNPSESVLPSLHCPLCNGLLSPAETRLLLESVETLSAGKESDSCVIAEGLESCCLSDQSTSCSSSSSSSSSSSGSCCSKPTPVPSKISLDALCYGCQRLAQDGKPDLFVSLLPPSVSRSTQKISNDLNLRKQIEEFLLDDEDDVDDQVILS